MTALKIVNGSKDDPRETLSDREKKFVEDYKNLDQEGKSRMDWALHQYNLQKEKSYVGY